MFLGGCFPCKSFIEGYGFHVLNQRQGCQTGRADSLLMAQPCHGLALLVGGEAYPNMAHRHGYGPCLPLAVPALGPKNMFLFLNEM